MREKERRKKGTGEFFFSPTFVSFFSLRCFQTFQHLVEPAVEPRAGLQGGLVDRGEVLHERVPLLELLRLLLLLLLQLFVFGGVGVGAGNRSGQRRRRLRRRRSLLELALWLLLLLLVIHRRLLLRGGQGVVRDPGEERGHCFSRGFFALRENKGGGGGGRREV